eukprot:1178634-Pleurochrysis_carterae.AAC.2
MGDHGKLYVPEALVAIYAEKARLRLAPYIDDSHAHVDDSHAHVDDSHAHLHVTRAYALTFLCSREQPHACPLHAHARARTCTHTRTYVHAPARTRARTCPRRRTRVCGTRTSAHALVRVPPRSRTLQDAL